jgi:chromosome segregation ATPase
MNTPPSSQESFAPGVIDPVKSRDPGPLEMAIEVEETANLLQPTSASSDHFTNSTHPDSISNDKIINATASVEEKVPVTIHNDIQRSHSQASRDQLESRIHALQIERVEVLLDGLLIQRSNETLDSKLQLANAKIEELRARCGGLEAERSRSDDQIKMLDQEIWALRGEKRILQRDGEDSERRFMERIAVLMKEKNEFFHDTVELEEEKCNLERRIQELECLLHAKHLEVQQLDAKLKQEKPEPVVGNNLTVEVQDLLHLRGIRNSGLKDANRKMGEEKRLAEETNRTLIELVGCLEGLVKEVEREVIAQTKRADNFETMFKMVTEDKAALISEKNTLEVLVETLESMLKVLRSEVFGLKNKNGVLVGENEKLKGDQKAFEALVDTLDGMLKTMDREFRNRGTQPVLENEKAALWLNEEGLQTEAQQFRSQIQTLKSDNSAFEDLARGLGDLLKTVQEEYKERGVRTKGAQERVFENKISTENRVNGHGDTVRCKILEHTPWKDSGSQDDEWDKREAKRADNMTTRPVASIPFLRTHSIRCGPSVYYHAADGAGAGHHKKNQSPSDDVGAGSVVEMVGYGDKHMPGNNELSEMEKDEGGENACSMESDCAQQ